MLARLERQRAKSGTVKLSVTLLLFCHVNAVMTGNFVSTAPAHVLGNVRGFHLSFAVLLAASHYASGRSCERPTDRHRFSRCFCLTDKCRDGAKDSKLLLNDFCAAFAIYIYQDEPLSSTQITAPNQKSIRQASLFIIQTSSFSFYCQKDERAKPGTN